MLPAGMMEEIIKLAHKQEHFAVKKIEDLLNKNYYIPNANEKVQKVFLACI